MSRLSGSAVWVAAVVIVVGGAACAPESGEDGSGGALGYDRIALGTDHIYRLTQPGGGISSYTTRITASSPTGFTRRSEDSWTGSSISSTYTVANGGEYLTGSIGSTVANYSPSAVILPADLTPGRTTTTVSSVTGSSSYTNTRAATVDGVENVTVPAGTFAALKVTTIVNGSTANVAWWAAGTGRVKIVNYPIATPTSTSTYELISVTTGPVAPTTLDGTYVTSAIRCNGTPAPSPIADLITPPYSMTFAVNGSTGSTTWSDGACTIVQPNAFTYPTATSLTMAGSGPFTCAPSAAICASLSTATFGGSVCGATDVASPRAYTFDPATLAANGTVTLTRVGGAECADAAASDPASYVLTLQ